MRNYRFKIVLSGCESKLALDISFCICVSNDLIHFNSSLFLFWLLTRFNVLVNSSYRNNVTKLNGFVANQITNLFSVAVKFTLFLLITRFVVSA